VDDERIESDIVPSGIFDPDAVPKPATRATPDNQRDTFLSGAVMHGLDPVHPGPTLV
jgi:hypothetical protein